MPAPNLKVEVDGFVKKKKMEKKMEKRRNPRRSEKTFRADMKKKIEKKIDKERKVMTEERFTESNNPNVWEYNYICSEYKYMFAKKYGYYLGCYTPLEFRYFHELRFGFMYDQENWGYEWVL